MQKEHILKALRTTPTTYLGTEYRPLTDSQLHIRKCIENFSWKSEEDKIDQKM